MRGTELLDAPPEGFDVRPAADSDASGVIALYSACWGEHDGMILDTVGEMAHLNHVASHYERAGGAAWVIERARGPRDPDAGAAVISASVAWRPIRRWPYALFRAADALRPARG